MAALEHDWLSSRVHEKYNDESDKRPLLDISDVEDALIRLGRALEDVDVNWVINTLCCGGSFAPPRRKGKDLDDRLQNCVVCFSIAGELAQTCAQCQQSVCSQCLQRLPKASCPHCRHSIVDDNAAQNNVFPPKSFEKIDNGDKIGIGCKLGTATDENGEGCRISEVQVVKALNKRESKRADGPSLQAPPEESVVSL
jgi:hypothetical protein